MSTRRFSTRNNAGEGQRANSRNNRPDLSSLGFTGPPAIDYYLVGGGASGGTGGGGAGGVSPGTIQLGSSTSPNVKVIVTVGAGGTNGSPGSNTTVSTPVYTGYGVGGGGESTPGGSGGGAGRDQPNNSGRGLGFPGQGNQGGDGSGNQHAGAAGGGGASQAGNRGASGGGSPDGERGGKGGNGTTNNWIGPTISYAGGGGGSCQNNIFAPPSDGGGGGGGGPGRNGQTAFGLVGNVNTGGGGGGAQAGPSGNGGSGTAILRYPTAYTAVAITGNVETFNNVSGYTVYKFNGPGILSFTPLRNYVDHSD